MEYNWFTVLLVSTVLQCESATCTQISPPSRASLQLHAPPPRQVITERGAEFPVLYNSFPSAIYFTHGSVYMSILCYQFISPSCSCPFPCPCHHSLCLCLYSCPANKFISTIFSRFHIYEGDQYVANDSNSTQGHCFFHPISYIL